MDLRQLRSFLAIIDHGSFSAAARALFTVQSNVSSHVARLEDDLGATLLDRSTRQLTPAGRVVETRAREIVRQLTAITDDLASLENRVIGAVACGTTPSIGLWLIPSTLAQANRELPEVAIRVVEAHSGTLVHQLLAGEIDLAITTGASNPELTSTPLVDEDIVAVMSPQHGLAAQPEVTLADLAGLKLLLPLQDNPLHDHITRAFLDRGLALRSRLEVGSSALVRAMAAADVGVALIPATAAVDRDGLDCVVKAVRDMPRRGVALTTRTGMQRNRALEAVAAIIEQTARDTVGSMPGCVSVGPPSPAIERPGR